MCFVLLFFLQFVIIFFIIIIITLQPLYNKELKEMKCDIMVDEGQTLCTREQPS